MLDLCATSRHQIVNATFGLSGEIKRAQQRTINGDLMPVMKDSLVEPFVKGQLSEPRRSNGCGQCI